MRRHHGVHLVAPHSTVGAEGTTRLGAPADFVALAKPRIVALVLFTVAAGYAVGIPAAARGAKSLIITRKKAAMTSSATPGRIPATR